MTKFDLRKKINIGIILLLTIFCGIIGINKFIEYKDKELVENKYTITAKNYIQDNNVTLDDKWNKTIDSIKNIPQVFNGSPSKDIEWEYFDLNLEDFDITNPTVGPIEVKITSNLPLDGVPNVEGEWSLSDGNMTLIGKFYENTNDTIRLELSATSPEGVIFTDGTIVIQKISNIVPSVEIPTNALCTNPTYTGVEQLIANVDEAEKYTLVGNNKRNAGTYTVRARLKDPASYRWTDNTVEDKSFTCTIEKATPSVTITPASGEVVANGEIEFTEKSTAVGTFTNEVLTNGVLSIEDVSTGEKTKSIKVKGLEVETGKIKVTFNPTSANYNVVTKEIDVKVLPSVEIPTNALCTNPTYTGVEQLIANVDESEKYTLVGNNKKNAGTYTVRARLKDPTSYRWTDNTVEDKPIECKIDKATPSVTITPASGEVVANGEIEFTEKSTAVGTFTNEVLTNGVLSIEDVSTGEKTKSIKVKGLEVETGKIKVTFNPTSANYNVVTKEIDVKVLPSVEIPTNALCTNPTYTGVEQLIANVDESEKYTLVGNNKKNAGTYTVRARLKDPTSYRWTDNTIEDKTFACTIEKATPNLTITPASGEVVVNGEIDFTEKATAVGTFTNEVLTNGVLSIEDVSTGEKTKSIKVKGLEVETGKIKVTFNPTSANYNVVTKEIDVKVLPSVEIPTNALCTNPTYSGVEQQLTTITGTDKYTLSGYENTNAGTYTITAKLIDKTNYRWTDNTVGDKTFTCKIDKATPEITLSETSGNVGVGITATFTEKANVKGKFINESQDETKLIVSSETSSTSIEANTELAVTLKGVKAGNSKVTVTFIPDDTTNYNEITATTPENAAKTYTAKVVNVATIPTSDLCNTNLVYDGTLKQLVGQLDHDGYTLSGYSKVDAGEHTITATLNENYMWLESNETLSVDDKTFTCTIGKATPEITLSETSGNVGVGITATFIEQANVKGKFTNESQDTTKLKVNPGTSSTSIEANTESIVTLTGVKAGNSKVTVTFIPDDTENYNEITATTPENAAKTYTAKVVNVATIPTTTYCKNLTYNGNIQTVVNEAGEGYSWIEDTTKRKDAGTQTVTATLSSEYMWLENDGTLSSGTKPIECIIEKAESKLTLSVESGEVVEGKPFKFIEKPNITGKLANTSSNNEVAQVTEATSTYDYTGADKDQRKEVEVEINGLKNGKSTITVVFKPNNSNYKEVTKTFELTVMKKAEIPTNALCESGLIYNMQPQQLTKETTGIGYRLENYMETTAGSHDVMAILEPGYRWEDNTVENKTFTCTIGKATPEITLSETSGNVGVGITATFTEQANVKGKFTNESQDTTKLKVNPGTSSTSIEANTESIVTLTGVKAGNSKVTVTFIPDDTENYNEITATTPENAAKIYTAKVVNVATIPTNDLCNTNLVYDGTSKQLVGQLENDGYTLSGYNKVDAGEHTIGATLNENYMWLENDGTLSSGTKTFTCIVGQAVPEITLSETSGTVVSGGEITFTEKASTVGTFTNESQNTAKVTVNPETYENVDANVDKTVTLTGQENGTARVIVTFTPSSTNYVETTKEFNVEVLPSAEIPTSALCKNDAIYNGQKQQITTIEGTEQYTLKNYRKINAGKYKITATLKDGYRWTDNTTEDKTFTCTIGKATPEITLSETNGTVVSEGEIKFTEQANVAGTFTNESQDVAKVILNLETYENVDANVEKIVTLTGKESGNGTVKITFTPIDTINYQKAEELYTLTVLNAAVIPTSDNLCKTNLVYDRTNQLLTQNAEYEGYTLTGNYQTHAGEYPIIATLKDGYRWTDNTTENKTFNCSIAKAIPTIKLVGPSEMTLQVNVDSYTEQGAKVSYDYDTEKDAIISGDTVDTTKIADYVVKYTAIDDDGNEDGTVTRTVHVVDTSKPTITLTGDATVVVKLHSTYEEEGAVVTDNYDATKAAAIGGDTVDTTKIGEYVVKYTAVDTHGNEAIPVTRTVKVVANETSNIVRDNNNCSETGICYNTSENDNYVWYSGYLWRIVSVNKDNTIKLVTEDSIAAFTYDDDSSIFKDSIVKDWLNNKFYPTLNNSSKIVVEAPYCNRGRPTSEGETFVNGCTEVSNVKGVVGLLTMDDYYAVGGKQSFLNNGDQFFTMTRSSDKTVWVIDINGVAQSGYTVNGNPFAIRPVITISNKVKIVSGNGTKSNPYRLENDNSASANDLLNSRHAGEYVKFHNQKWRIVSSGNQTKIVLDSLYQVDNLPVKLSVGESGKFNLNDGIGYYLNNDFYNTLSLAEKAAMDTLNLNVSEYTLGGIPGNSNNPNNRISVKVGLNNIGGILSGNISTIRPNSEGVTAWLMNYDGNYQWFTSTNGTTAYSYTNDIRGIKPLIALRSDVTIKSGKGTYESPYELNIG